MSIAITRAQVKEKCAITTSDYDSQIDSLIGQLFGPIEYLVRPEHLADNALSTTLSLGATEYVAGEFLSQLARQPGWLDTMKLGDLQLAPFVRPDPLDPSGLKAQGLARLRLYLKTDPGVISTAPVRGDGGRQQEPQ